MRNPGLIMGLAMLFTISIFAESNVLEATRTEKMPTLDGKLDEGCWKHAKWNNSFLVNNTAKISKYKTKTAVIYDDSTLYIGIRCEEPDIKSLDTRPLPRDHNDVFRTDCVDIMLDPTQSEDEYYHFVINASGSVFDRTCTQGGFIGDDRWNGAVKAHSFIGDSFWSCEVAIPFYTLEITRKVGETWGINICREKKKPSEDSSIAKDGAFHIANRFAKLKGLKVDFSRFRYKISTPTPKTAIKNGKLEATMSILLENNTGNTQKVLLDFWLTSPSKKLLIDTREIQLPENKRIPASTDKLILTERGDYQYTIRIADVTMKKPLSVKKGVMSIQFVPMSIKLIKPWYRNAIFATQHIEKVEIDVTVNLPKKERDGKILIIGISSTGNPENLIKKEIKSVTATNHISFKVSKIPFGKLIIHAVLKNKKGENIAETTHPLLKLRYKKGEVWLDRDMQWRVDGKPFFMRGAWNYKEDFLPEYNVFTAEKSGNSKYIDTQLMNLLHYKCKSLRTSDSLTKREIELCVNHIRKMKDKDYLFAYYTSDEPEGSGISAKILEQVYNIIRQEDPYHPVIISNNSISGIETYAKCAEINGLHPYPPILKDRTVNDLTKVVVFIENAVKFFKVSDDKQTIAYLNQGFNYGDYGATNNRVPNYCELRNQNFLSVICGGKGFLQFNRMISHYPELYIGMPHLVREWAELNSVFLAPKAKVVPKADDEKIRMLLKNVNGDLVLLACNLSMGPIKATIEIPGISHNSTNLQVISEKRTISLNGDDFTDDFKPFEVHLYTTSKKSSTLPTVNEICKEITKAKQKRRKPGNLAFQMFEGDGVTITASSSRGAHRRPDSGLWHVVDGFTNTTTDRYHCLAWHDKTPNEYPDWLEVQLPKERAIGKIVVYPFKKSLKDYSVQVFSKGQWIEVSRVFGKNTDRIEHLFKPVKTDRVRLWITASNGPYSEVDEVELYEK